jgi:glycine/D-amino acid oxidase-like deaminating enzyme
MPRTVFERQPASDRIVGHALAHTRTEPFWLADLDAPTRYPALVTAGRYDLVVVGGGYTGLWSALLAVQRNPGLRVAVLEGRQVGWAASGRNGGFVEASLTHGEENGRRRWPGEMDTLDRLGMENLDAIENTVGTLGLDCDFERPGVLSVALEDYQVDGLREAPDTADSTFLDADAVRAQVNSPTYLAGRWTRERTALIQPAKLAAELARVCREHGVDVFENTQVAGLSGGRRGGPIRVDAGATHVLADRIILATNVFPSLLKRYRYHTVPVYDYVLVTEPLTAEQRESIGWRDRQGIADTSNQFHYYRLTPDNRILFGGYDAIYHYGRGMAQRLEDRPATYRRLASHFFTTFPQLEGMSFTHQWAGVIDTSTRFCAFFGSAYQGRVAYAAGFTGLGVAATRFAANVMLDMTSGAKTERTELEMVRSTPMPFPPEPLAWFGINATRWSLDRADHQRGRRNLFLRTLDAAGLGFDS